MQRKSNSTREKKAKQKQKHQTYYDYSCSMEKLAPHKHFPELLAQTE